MTLVALAGSLGVRLGELMRAAEVEIGARHAGQFADGEGVSQ